MKSRKCAGFSLIELMVVVTIIGVLASFAVPAYENARYAAGDRTVKTDLRHAMTALDFHMARFGSYPSDLSTLESMTGFTVSSRVTFTKFDLKTKNGNPSVHMHAQYEGSPNAWHADYPKEETEIKRRNPK